MVRRQPIKRLKRMTAAIYARVSTDDQSCAMQLSELRGYCQRSGWEVVEYVDQGVSGTKRSRPALNRLMTDARMKRFDVVLVWKLDRFGRSLQHLVENVQTLDALGIRFVAPTQNIDTDTRSPMGKFLMHLFAAFAEFERDLIVERVRAGIAEAKRQGKHCGRPQRVFRRDLVVEARAQGKSWRQISHELGVPISTVRTAAGALRKPSRR